MRKCLFIPTQFWKVNDNIFADMDDATTYKLALTAHDLSGFHINSPVKRTKKYVKAPHSL